MLLPGRPSAQEFAEISPLDLVGADFPPTAFFHGTADLTLLPVSSEVMHHRLLELGVATELHVFAERGHEFDQAPTALRACVAMAASFIDRQVARPEVDAEENRRYAFPPTQSVEELGRSTEGV